MLCIFIHVIDQRDGKHNYKKRRKKTCMSVSKCFTNNRSKINQRHAQWAESERKRAVDKRRWQKYAHKFQELQRNRMHSRSLNDVKNNKQIVFFYVFRLVLQFVFYHAYLSVILLCCWSLLCTIVVWLFVYLLVHGRAWNIKKII